MSDQRNTPETNGVIAKQGSVLSLETRLIEKCADLECERNELLKVLNSVSDELSGIADEDKTKAEINIERAIKSATA